MELEGVCNWINATSSSSSFSIASFWWIQKTFCWGVFSESLEQGCCWSEVSVRKFDQACKTPVISDIPVSCVGAQMASWADAVVSGCFHWLLELWLWLRHMQWMQIPRWLQSTLWALLPVVLPVLISQLRLVIMAPDAPLDPLNINMQWHCLWYTCTCKYQLKALILTALEEITIHLSLDVFSCDRDLIIAFFNFC